MISERGINGILPRLKRGAPPNVDHANPSRCPLCRSADVRRFAEVQGRVYLDCAECGLVHLAPVHRLSVDEELAHYGWHENDPGDPRYRAFLSRLADPLVARLRPRAEGLDYGAGPGPTLSVMLEEHGFRMNIYDPFFAPDSGPLERTYDFITCTETAEHFFAPGEELSRLDRMLRPAGWLAVMTETLRSERERSFATWRYARDPTHVCFYRPETMEWISGRFGWSLERPSPDVAMFLKPAKDGDPVGSADP